MSFLKKVLGKESSVRKLPENIDGVEDVKIVQLPKDEFGKKHSGGVGIHFLDDEDEIKDAKSHKLHELLEDALKDGFPAIYIYNLPSKVRKPHLYVVKSSTGEIEYK